ncbi:hypothetical protein ACFGVR_16800 [Mucilaginibacter sp. AW1-3]
MTTGNNKPEKKIWGEGPTMMLISTSDVNGHKTNNAHKEATLLPHPYVTPTFGSHRYRTPGGHASFSKSQVLNTFVS